MGTNSAAWGTNSVHRLFWTRAKWECDGPSEGTLGALLAAVGGWQMILLRRRERRKENPRNPRAAPGLRGVSVKKRPCDPRKPMAVN